MDELIQQLEFSLRDRKTIEVMISRYLEHGTLSLLIWQLDQCKLWVLYDTLTQNFPHILRVQLVMSHL
jgi:hypothetical protein